MTLDQATAPSMYCRKCGYQLVGLSENRCPECGWPFDPLDSRTFLRHQRNWTLRRWARRIGLACVATGLLIAVGVGGPWSYVYWTYHADWQTELEAIAAFKAIGVDTSYARKSIRRSSGGLLDRLITPVNYLTYRVSTLNADDRRLADADFARMSAFKHLELVNLAHGVVTDDQLACLAGMKDLQTLVLLSHPRGPTDDHQRITDTGLAHLKGMTSLTFLNLFNTGISGEGLKYLQKLPRLQRLQLAYTPITDDALSFLEAYPALSELSLEGTAITDAGLVHLKAMPALRGLDMRATKITDEGCIVLGQMTNLTGLNLARTSVTDAGLENLRGLKNVRFLNVLDTRVTGEGVERLQKALPASAFRIAWDGMPGLQRIGGRHTVARTPTATLPR